MTRIHSHTHTHTHTHTFTHTHPRQNKSLRRPPPCRLLLDKFICARSHPRVGKNVPQITRTEKGFYKNVIEPPLFQGYANKIVRRR